MIGRAGQVLAAVLAAFGLVSSARAQDVVLGAIGRPVAAVQFEVEDRPVTSAELQSLVPIRIGDPLQLEAVREAESHLVSAGGYEDVQVSYTDAPDGLHLLFNLTPRHPIDRLEFTGATGLPANELERQLRERYGGLPAREPPQGVALALAGLLRDEGFPEAKVEPRVDVTHNPDRATLVLNVAAGPRPPIARTDVEGTSPLSPARIIELTNAAPGQPLLRSDLEARLVAIEDDLRKQGYYSAVALLPSDPILTDSGFVVTLLVNAGPRVTLRWDGPQPPGDPEEFVPMRRQRSVDEDLLEDSDQRVAVYWRRQGFRDVRVTHSREVQADQLVVTMHVDRGLQYVTGTVRITGNANMSDDAVRETLGVRPGVPYDQSLVSAGLARLRTSYLRLGYYQVSVKELDPEEVARTPNQVHVDVRIEVAEGPQARVGTIELAGVSPPRQAAVRRLMTTKPGAPYVRELLERDRAEIEAYYRNLGFESVQVGIPQAAPRENAASLEVTVNVDEGPQILVGDIRIVGNRRVSEQAIKSEITLKEGQPFGEAARRESTRRLYQMGVFRQVSIDEEPRASGDTVAHVIVAVEELPATSIAYGGGLEGGRQPLKTPDGAFEDRTFFAPRGFFEVGRRNLWGKNRSIDLFSRVAPRPATTTSENFGFLEYRMSATYREPHAFESDTDVTVGLASEQAVRTGFNFFRRSATLQVLRRLSNQVSVTGRYGLEHTRLRDVDPTIIGPADQVTVDRLFPQVRLSLISGGAVWDRRDDPVDPAHGTLTSADLELAARGLGSQVGFAKVFLQTSAYHAVSSTPRTILAGRAELGLARGFERSTVDPATGVPVVTTDLPISQRFFAGGSTTVRGFQLDRLGASEVLTSDGLSQGGNGVVILNAELRTTIGRLLGREFGIATFADAGNVFAKASDLDLARLRASIGFGLRYNSPLGPVRLDFGFKTDRQTIGGRLERGWEYHLNIGEAF